MSTSVTKGYENPPSWSLACLMLTKKFSAWVYWKAFCHFWPINSRSIFLGIYFYHSFYGIPFLLFLFKTLVKSRQRSTFSCLNVVCQQSAEVFFLLKVKCPVFHFMDLDCRVLNLIYLKIRRKGKNLHCF